MRKWFKGKVGDVCSECNEELGPVDNYGPADYELIDGDKYCEACVEDLDQNDYFDDDYYLIDGVGFQDEGGNSSLRAETEDNPRNLPCPECGAEDVLTPLDRAAGYICNKCADDSERGY